MNRIERYKKTRAYLKLAFRTLREGCNGCENTCTCCEDDELEYKIIHIYSKIGSYIFDIEESESEEQNG